MEKITPTDPESHSGDLFAANIAKLKELFPEVVAEGKVDFKALQEILGNEVETGEEFYRFTWAGKAQARREAHKPSTGTLRPCPEESVDWDTTKNLYIEGDNLEVLKLLQKSYGGKVKMIYIDPPYNTGKDFVYKDNYHDNLRNYKELTGQLDSEGNTLSTNSDTDGRYHSNWLNMMYPRLRLARNLLREDGVMFVNMDENEIENLTKLCFEIFGETNFLGTIIWDKRNPKGDSRGIAYQHENIIVIAKNAEIFNDDNQLLRPKKNAERMLDKARTIFNVARDLNEANEEYSRWIREQSNLTGGERAYSKIDERGHVYRGVSMAWPNKKTAPKEYFIPLIHPKTGKPCPLPDRGWRNPPDTMQKLLKEGNILFGEDETKQPERKYLLIENMMENIPSLLYHGGSDTNLLKELEIPFDTPKCVSVCKEHIRAATKSADLILDFFSGSATTAHAVMQLNAEDGGERQHIQVQLPEPTDAKSEAHKAGYSTIAEIGKERIRRAGKKIVGELEAAIKALEAKAVRTDEEEQELKEKKERLAKLDIGFRVFKLDSSNIAAWDGDPERMQENLLSAAENIKPGRTEADVLYEVLLKYGLDLTLPIEERSIAKCTVYNVGMGALFLCLAERITNAVAEGIGQWKEELKPETCRVIFRDNGFTDVEKTNAVQTLKRYGVTEVRSV